VNDGAVTYAYDGDGNRVSKTVSGVTTTYLVDTNNPTGYAQAVEELRGGSVVRQHTYGHDLISQRQLVGGQWALSYYGYDGHGSVRMLTDSAGTVTDTYAYDAFGALISRRGSTSNEYLFAGERFDPETGMYHLSARYMNPSTGRFWSTDSYEGNLSDPASLHKYTYTHGDPVGYLDPSGHQEVTSLGMLAAVAVMVALAAYSLYTFAPVLDRIYSSTRSYTSSAPVEAETETGVQTSTETTTETTQEEDKDDDSEVFYRAMSEAEWRKV
jgi:RHS repeat-associated protein